MRNITKVVAGAAVAVAATATFSVPAANAAANDGSCQSGEACVWNGGNYTQGMADMAATDPNWHNNRFNAGAGEIVGNNAQSGGANGNAIVFYDGTSYSGAYFALAANYWDAGFGNGIGNALGIAGSSPGQNWANRISSSSIYILF